jgi:hypothetical protein
MQLYPPLHAFVAASAAQPAAAQHPAGTSSRDNAYCHVHYSQQLAANCHDKSCAARKVNWRILRFNATQSFAAMCVLCITKVSASKPQTNLYLCDHRNMGQP